MRAARGAAARPRPPGARPATRAARQAGCRPLAAAPDADVVIVGAGAAGLAAALDVAVAGLTPLLVEASDGVGGRVRTDVVPDPAGGGDFLLDRGFQIFLTSYPTARAMLDYAALDLRPFYAGATVRFDGGWHRVADPFRHPLDALATLSPSHAIGSPADKLRVGLLRLQCALQSGDTLLAGEPESSTLASLRARAFSEAFIDRFFRPFLGGIFFDADLKVTDRLLNFVMASLATGQNCLPAAGIGAVPAQLAARLPPGCLRLNEVVDRVEGARPGSPAAVHLASGETVRARLGVVVATDAAAASTLLGPALAAAPSAAGAPVGTACVYFRWGGEEEGAGRGGRGSARGSRPTTLPTASAPSPVLANEPVLMLNGDRSAKDPQSPWRVNNACSPSAVAPSYAPPNRHLVSTSVLGVAPDLDDGALIERVRADMGAWLGEGVEGWGALRVYRVAACQPPQAPPTDLCRPASLGAGLYVAGDHRAAATLDGALASGRRAAAAVVAAK